ncbi:MAG: electron transport complex subunit RsxC [Candidatus Omnitrophota bacterium]
MVRIAEYKFYTEHKRIETLPPPAIVYIPIIQHLGKPCDIFDIKPGDQVSVGQRLAIAASQPFAPIHSSVSGKVTAIQNWPHPAAGTCKTIVIENDSLDSPVRAPAGLMSGEEAGNLTAKHIRDLVFEAGIVGMGGASFPTHIKLQPPKPVSTLIINIAECEPYLTGDSQLTVEKTDQIVAGIGLVGNCFPHLKKTIIAIEDNKPAAIKALEKATAGTPLIIGVLKAQYPQGGEKQLIKKLLGVEVPRAKLPFDVGVSVQNVSTVFAIYEAVYARKPLYERVVTVTGSCLTDPKNLLCRIGTPIKELIKYCGPVKETPAKIIIGGPMMGLAQYTDDAPVIKSTTGVILMNKREARAIEETPCIRCGGCVRECSMGLMPCLINQAAGKGFWQQAKDHGALDCLECGLCNYVCPAHRSIVQSIKRAKLEIR